MSWPPPALVADMLVRKPAQSALDARIFGSDVQVPVNLRTLSVSLFQPLICLLEVAAFKLHRRNRSVMVLRADVLGEATKELTNPL